MDQWNTRQNALYSIDPFKHKNGRVNNNTLIVNMQIQLAWQQQNKAKNTTPNF
jgi:hypothetical protein